MRKTLILTIILSILAFTAYGSGKKNDIEIQQDTLHNIANFIRGTNYKHKDKIIESLQNAWIVLEEEKNIKEPTYLGTFKVYAYCPCSYCCSNNLGITAMGTKATAGRTIAVDPKVIPLGSKVIINGNTYIAEDTGGGIKGNKIDMFFNSHQEALNWGIKTLDVFILN